MPTKEEIYAREMEISVQDLEGLDYEEGEEISNDGLLYNYHLTFSPANPPEIIGRIKGMDSGRTVYFSPGLFAEADDY